MSTKRLCNNETNWPLIIECYDWDREGTDDLIGIIKVQQTIFERLHSIIM